MNSLLVLGIIPGTDIQTNLNFWLVVYVVVVTVVFRLHILRIRSKLQTQIIARRIARAINSCELANLAL